VEVVRQVKRPATDGNTGPRLQAFASELEAVLAAADMSQAQLARALGLTPTAVNKWILGHNAPRPEQVFRLEALLGLPAGYLSRHLGYIPTNASPELVIAAGGGVLAAISADPLLTDQEKAALRLAYTSLVRDRYLATATTGASGASSSRIAWRARLIARFSAGEHSSLSWSARRRSTAAVAISPKAIAVVNIPPPSVRHCHA